MRRCRTGKVAHRDRIAALLVLATITRRDRSSRPELERRAYRCPHCRAWHLTSQGSARAVGRG